MRGKWTLAGIMVLLVCVAVGARALIGCDAGSGTADKVQTQKTLVLMDEAEAQVGMPAIHNFQERKLAKMIFELRDKEDLVCHAYIVAKMTGKLVYIGKCIGYGLPYSVQYTNPQRPQWGYNGAAVTVPQPDPNGLFMPEGLSATWIMLIDPTTNKPRPVYVEPEIIVSPFPLHKLEN